MANRLLGRLAQYVEAFSGRVCKGCSFGSRGELYFRDAEDRERAFSALNGEEKAQVEIALQFALVQHIVKKQPLPVILDDPMVLASKKEREFFARALALLGQRSQVIMMTPLDDLPGDSVQVE